MHRPISIIKVRYIKLGDRILDEPNEVNSKPVWLIVIDIRKDADGVVLHFRNEADTLDRRFYTYDLNDTVEIES